MLFDNFRQWAIVPSDDVGGVDGALCVEVDGATKSYAADRYGLLCDQCFACCEYAVNSFVGVVCAICLVLDVFDDAAVGRGKGQAKLSAADVNGEDHDVAPDGNSVRRTSRAMTPEMAMAVTMEMDEAL